MFSNLSSALFQPLRYCPGGIGNWSGHLPCAADLIEATRPSSVVELGIQYGESYFGFCQAIQECGLSSVAHAVDTWEGDSRTGPHGLSVFKDVSVYNAAHYRPFSTLLRMSFDEATTHFADGTIDLLHLDACRTYAAVKHDFESWLPKVSQNGIILIHDVAVRESDLGVWRFWEEISACFPSFAFHHSGGLGIIAKANAG
jgi:hypothetical protein